MSQEEREIVDNIANIMKERHVRALKGFKKVYRGNLNEVIRKVNDALKYITTKTISDTNRLINSVAIYIGQKIGLKTNENKKCQEREPWWKRSMGKKVNELRKHTNILERHKRGEMRKKEKISVLEEYKIRRRGIDNVIEELKQLLAAKTAKVKRYEQRMQQYRINRMFQYDQNKVYQELNGENQEEGMRLDAHESRVFWSAIWGEKEHKKDAE